MRFYPQNNNNTFGGLLYEATWVILIWYCSLKYFDACSCLAINQCCHCLPCIWRQTYFYGVLGWRSTGSWSCHKIQKPPRNSAWQKAAAEKSHLLPKALVSDLDGLIKIKEKVNVTQWGCLSSWARRVGVAKQEKFFFKFSRNRYAGCKSDR